MTLLSNKYFLFLFSSLLVSTLADAQNDSLIWPLNENNAGTGGVYMDRPESYTEEVIYQPEDNTYLIIYKMGEVEVGRETLSYSEYTAYRERQKREEYWRKKENDRINGEESNSLIPALNIAGEAFKGIFGSNKIEIRPQGTVELIMGGIFNTNLNPSF